MLRQILNDMYVDPEILSGLDEYQKQTLFCKMREEQIRRWRIREQENDNGTTILQRKKSTPNKKNKNVSFREDDEGEPWVIVIEPAIYTDSDSDDSDLSMKKPGHEEAKQRARELAEIETKELRRQYKEIITADSILGKDSNGTNCKNDLKKSLGHHDVGVNDNDDVNDVDVVEPVPIIIDDMEIYCSVDELRERMNQSKLLSNVVNGSINAPKLKNGNAPKPNCILNFSFSANAQNEKNASILKEISTNKPQQKVSAKIALWEQRVIGEKTNEIYQRLRKKQKEQAQEEAKKQEEAWKEQERKAKEADIQYREIARRAREEHRKSLSNDETMTTATTATATTTNLSASTANVFMKNGNGNAAATANHNSNGVAASTNGLLHGIRKPAQSLATNGTTNGHNGTATILNGINKMNGTSTPPPSKLANGLMGNGHQHHHHHSPITNGNSTKGPAPQPPSIQQPQHVSSASSSPPTSLDALIPRPSSHDAMIQWYHDVEIGKGAGLESIESRLTCKWFYGLMSRTEAEQLLEDEPMGTFLVRLSEKIWGYAISYKDVDRCKHYLINASTGQYKFLGANQLSHSSLNNLIKHHATVPITAMGNELLIRPCPRSVAVNSKIFDGLF